MGSEFDVFFGVASYFGILLGQVGKRHDGVHDGFAIDLPLAE
jgi:hypothetical protein